MKKQYFILSVIASMLAIINVKAQNTPIDDFLKKYPSREGVTNVSVSQEMLQSIFAPPKNPTSNSFQSELYSARVSRYGNFNVPESYSSVSISKIENPATLFNDFKKTLLSSKYEQFMEMNRENSSILGYYKKKVNEKTNEIVVLRQQNNQFSAIYIKGEIDVNEVDRYLNQIRDTLSRMGADNQTGMFLQGHQFAFEMPSFKDFRFPDIQEFNFKFNPDSFKFKMDEDLKLRLEESMQGVKDMIKNLEFNEDYQRMIQDAIDGVQKQ